MDASLQNNSFRVYFSNIDNSFGHQFQIAKLQNGILFFHLFLDLMPLFLTLKKNMSYPLKLISQSANELILEASINKYPYR